MSEHTDQPGHIAFCPECQQRLFTELTPEQGERLNLESIQSLLYRSLILWERFAAELTIPDSPETREQLAKDAAQWHEEYDANIQAIISMIEPGMSSDIKWHVEMEACQKHPRVERLIERLKTR